jgi:integrase
VLQAQLESIETLKEKGTITPYVFPRADGSQIKELRDHWTSACEAAGYPGTLIHDFRRTAVRNLEWAGVPRGAAMRMIGHKTEAIYRRYGIVDETMHREGAARWPAEP